MPTKYFVCNWLCEYCSHTYTEASQCIVHERHAHAAQARTTNGDDLSVFEQICDRMGASEPSMTVNMDYDQLCKYERLCRTLLDIVCTMKTSAYDGSDRRGAAGGTVMKRARLTMPQPATNDSTCELTDELLCTPVFFSDQTTALISRPPSPVLETQENTVTVNLSTGDSIKRNECKVGATSIDNGQYTRHRCCGVTYTLHDELIAHRRHAHAAFTCATCGMVYGSSGTLKSHMRTHTGVRPFACTNCDKTFTTSGGRREHMYSHN
jgi:hypothetical protein